ncbi:MAG: leucine-rich repeat domain-containing protein [Bacteroidales bacterium]|nr:leucine-rich repeat domain-containing protein [Bacteroidales bacterium]
MKRTLLLICTLLCANVLSAQTRFWIDSLQYEVTSTNPAEVEVCASQLIVIADIPETVSYEGTTYSVTSIGESTFWFCYNLTSVTIPNSVTSIGERAFERCHSLTSVTIPNSVTSIGEKAFRECINLTSVDIPNSVTSIEDYTFYDCSDLTSVTIPNSVTSIGVAAFANCSDLTSVNIPNSVTSIAWVISDWGMEHLFEGCSSLTSMTIDMSNIMGNTTYYESPFNIPSLQNLTLGENVTSIGSGAFNDCSSLQNVTCLATTPPTLEDNTVFPNPNTATLTVPCGSLEAYSALTSFWNMFFAGRISENGYNVEVSVNDETFGSVAVESDCSTATLTATASEGYVFLSWNDGNTDNPRTVALTSDTSFTAIFALIDESSLSEDAEFADLSVYPNPTRGKVTFNQTIEKIEVIDLSGKTLQTYENANEINMESLPAGVYHLRMTIEDKTTTRKIIKE